MLKSELLAGIIVLAVAVAAQALSPDLVQALLRYASRHQGSLQVPASYICPDTSLPLGREVGRLRRMKRRARLSPTDEALLSSMDFVWSPRDKQFDIIFNALAVFKQRNGGVLHVPQAFVVPRDDEHYAPIARGLRLGTTPSPNPNSSSNPNPNPNSNPNSNVSNRRPLQIHPRRPRLQ